MFAALVFAEKVMTLLPAILAGVEGAAEAFDHGRTVVGRMVAEKRGPTEDEQGVLDRRTEELRTALHTD